MGLVSGLHRSSFDSQALRRLAGLLTLVIALRKQPLARFSDVPSRMLAHDDVGGEDRVRRRDALIIRGPRPCACLQK
jgi:hypothetical protein